MTRKRSTGTCEHCAKSFPYYLIHNGFNESAYAYCDACGITTLLDGWTAPDEINIEVHTVIKRDDEQLLPPCVCGGTFKSGASPRCPHCHQPLSAEAAQEWIEANAPGTAEGWKWPCSWTGLYAIVVGDKFVKNNWRPGASGQQACHIP